MKDYIMQKAERQCAERQFLTFSLEIPCGFCSTLPARLLLVLLRMVLSMRNSCEPAVQGNSIYFLKKMRRNAIMSKGDEDGDQEITGRNKDSRGSSA